MNDQDFDAYADFKRFNANVADTWDMALTEAMQRVARPAADIRLLDYGCGDGKYFAHLIGKKGMAPDNVHGVEVAERRVQRCHAIGWHNARLLTPGAPMPYGDASFDIVNCMEVIEHIPAPQAALAAQELRRVLRPDGVLLISTPNYPIKRVYDFSDAILHRKWSRLRDDPTHVTHFNQQRLRSLLGASFRRIEPRPFKAGFLYKRLPRPFLLHKLFFLCQP